MSKFYQKIIELKKLDHFPCPQAWTTNFIFANGNVTCCTQNSTTLGNLENNTLQSIWNSTEAQNIRKNFLSGHYELAGCDAECPFLRGSYNPVQNPPKIEELIQPDIEIPNDDTVYGLNANLVLNDYLNQNIVCNGLPIFSDIFWLEKCNAACIQCNQDHNSNLIISDNIKNIIFDIAKHNNFLRFQGGEIFADPNFYPFLVNITNNNSNKYLKVYLITNGVFLNNNILNFISINSSKFKILLSIDGVNKLTFEKIRKNLKFSRLIDVIKKLSVIKKNNIDLDIILNFCVMKSNIHELVDACSFSIKYDIPINFAAIQGNFGYENFFYDKSLHKQVKEKIEKAKLYAKINSVQCSGLEGITARIENAKISPEYELRNSKVNPNIKKITFFSKLFLFKS